MPLTDLSPKECLAYRPELPVPEDLDAFWHRTLAELPDGTPEFTEIDNGLTQVCTYDVTVPGYQGQAVRGWLHLPVRHARPLGCVVEFLGYGRGRGLPHEKLMWVSAGFAHLVMDTRGQGWSQCPGDTPDEGVTAPGTVPGFVTRGLQRPEDHYYRRLYVDAVRCVEAVRAHPSVDPRRVVVTGFSQGGGIALAVSGLVPGLAGVLPDVPFLCNFRRGAQISGRGPYTEIAAHLQLHRDRAAPVFRTLSYFDAALLAERADAPALFSIAMMDEVCPPSTCFTAFNRYPAEKSLRVYEFNNHEGGGAFHEREQLAWVRELIPGV